MAAGIKYPVFAFLLLLFGCTNELEQVMEDTSTVLPTAITHNVDAIYSDSGRIKLELLAPLRYDYTTTSNYSEMPKGIRINFFDAKLRVVTQLTADYAIRYNKEGRVFVRGNVKIINEFGERLNTEALTWYNDSKTLWTDEFVEIHQKDRILYGDGLTANENFTNYKITHPQGSVSVNEGN